jgi:hypothetical protein
MYTNGNGTRVRLRVMDELHSKAMPALRNRSGLHVLIRVYWCSFVVPNPHQGNFTVDSLEANLRILPQCLAPVRN